MRIFRFMFFLLLAGGLHYVMLKSFSPLPPLGSFFNPFAGFWQNATQTDGLPPGSLHLEGLQQPVKIVYDSLLIPHIEAQNQQDLFFAQGYVSASLRLWQMEIQTHAAAGRLSEILGPKMLAYDRYQRRIGMTWGAENSLSKMMADSATKRAVLAYTQGVNAYINQLSPKQLPLEYKLMNYQPEAWQPIKTALLLKYMAYALTGHSTDWQLTKVLKKLGPELTEQLFPNYYHQSNPIISSTQHLNAQQTPPPAKPSNIFSHITMPDSMPTWQQPPAANGSNNWAVAGNKTTTGHPMLANDPHLNMTLPGIWLLMHLKAPGFEAAGATMPGAPCVISGFNRQIAWGVTNTYADVLDWYQVEINNSETAYKHNGQWRNLVKRTEVIKIKGQKPTTEEINYTLHGPIPYFDPLKPYKPNQTPTGHALAWQAHKPSNELKAFLGINAAANLGDFSAALAHYDCPAQNFCFADKNTIAMFCNGALPLKWPGQGKYILDGSNPQHQWNGYVPRNQIPHEVSPARGFVFSANQAPTDTTYPYYLNWHHSTNMRAKTIEKYLSENDKLTVKAMQQLQNDNTNQLAATVLPALIQMLNPKNLTEAEKPVLDTLRHWNYQNLPTLSAPTVFAKWWEVLKKKAFADETGNLNFLPTDDKTVHLILKDTASKFWDNQHTPNQTETIHDIVQAAFKASLDTLALKKGPMATGLWQWGRAYPARIPHLGKIPGLGIDSLPAPGSRTSVNATQQQHGPSWRMVVSVGPVVKAYGVFPGGQSGNPASPFYDNMVADWLQGRLLQIPFPTDVLQVKNTHKPAFILLP